MEERRVTPAQIWAAADLSPAVIYRYFRGERGRRINSQAARTIEKLAAALGVRPDYFLEYRVWRVQELVREHPALADDVYDYLVDQAEGAGATSTGGS